MKKRYYLRKLIIFIIFCTLISIFIFTKEYGTCDYHDDYNLENIKRKNPERIFFIENNSLIGEAIIPDNCGLMGEESYLIFKDKKDLIIDMNDYRKMTGMEVVKLYEEKTGKKIDFGNFLETLLNVNYKFNFNTQLRFFYEIKNEDDILQNLIDYIMECFDYINFFPEKKDEIKKERKKRNSYGEYHVFYFLILSDKVELKCLLESDDSFTQPVKY